MEEATRNLGKGEQTKGTATDSEIFAVSLDAEGRIRHEQESFDFQAEQKKLRKKKKDRWWLERPLVEQGPSPPLSSSTLQQIELVEIATKVNYEWSNRVLYCKSIRPALGRFNAIWTLVQDDSSRSNSVVTLSLWNYLYLQSNDQMITDNIESELPAETYMAVANPLMMPNTLWMDTSKEHMKTSPLMLMIRCDNPDCLHIFDNESDWRDAMKKQSLQVPHIPTRSTTKLLPSAYKEKGNEAFGLKAFQAALRAYQIALDLATFDPSDVQTSIALSCLANMAEACLQLECYDRAEEYARRVLDEYDPNHIKAQFRLARALLHRNRPSEAKEILLKIREREPKNTSTQSLLGDCLQAIMEKEFGRYNIRKMLGEATLSPKLPFHADFRSTKIDLGVTVVRPADGGTYRGVLAKDNIEEGTLLSASRSFAFAHQQRGIVDHATGVAQKRHLYEVSHVHQAVTALRNNPSLVPAFYQLEASGVVDTSEHDGHQPTIDLGKIRSILESNRFGVDLESPASPFELPSRSQDDEKEDSVGIGLWLSISLFNHSCTPNAAWAQIGNHMFVYATKHISKGEEVCISYVHPAFSFEDRREKFQRWNGGKGFECGCEWCHLLRNNQELREMNELVTNAQKRLGSGEGLAIIDYLIPTSRRQQIKQAHAELPERFQHTLYNIYMLEALLTANELDREGARTAVEAATKIGYAIRGGLRQETRVQDLCCLSAARMVCGMESEAEDALQEVCKHQLVLPSFADFQTLVMMTSKTFWASYSTETFVQRWPAIIKSVWTQRWEQLN